MRVMDLPVEEGRAFNRRVVVESRRHEPVRLAIVNMSADEDCMLTADEARTVAEALMQAARVSDR